MLRSQLTFNCSITVCQTQQAVWPLGSADMVCSRLSVTLTFDRLTLKMVRESHLRWGTFIPNLGTLGLWVLELFAMYAMDGQTDGQKDKSNAYCPLPYGRGHNKPDLHSTACHSHSLFLVSHSIDLSVSCIFNFKLTS